MITEGYLARHARGGRGGRDVALLDVVQDYALKLIHAQGFFDLGLTFKGGTALRKYHVGHQGRFSTDLDFAATEPGTGELLFEALQGASLHAVHFEIDVITRDRRARLRSGTPLGAPTIPSLIEVSYRPAWLPPQLVQPIRLFVHEGYEFEPVSVPVLALEEMIAEKLAAFRRRRLTRDLCDLAWFSHRPFDEPLVRRLTYLKVFVDVVDDGLGGRLFNPESDIIGLGPDSFDPEDVGILVGAVTTPEWIEAVRHRYAFLLAATPEEAALAECNPRERGLALAALRNVQEQFSRR